MSDTIDKQAGQETSFLQRWSQRKQQQQARPAPEPAEDTSAPATQAPAPVHEEDLPPVESLHEDSEVSMFLADDISESLRRQVLRKLFHMGKFNICDGLDDYADDYTVFESLTTVLDTRQQLQDINDKLMHNANEQAEVTAESTEETQQDELNQSACANDPEPSTPQPDESKES